MLPTITPQEIDPWDLLVYSVTLGDSRIQIKRIDWLNPLEWAKPQNDLVFMPNDGRRFRNTAANHLGWLAKLPAATSTFAR